MRASMTQDFQTIAALAVVALAATYLIARAIRKRKNPGCGSDCGAISPEIRDLKSRMRERGPGNR